MPDDEELIIDDDEIKFPSRISEMFFQFALFLPVYNKQQRLIVRGITGEDMAELIPQYLLDVAFACEQEPESFEIYARWSRDALNYILGETDVSPPLKGFNLEKYQALKNQVIVKRRMLQKQVQKEKKKNVR